MSELGGVSLEAVSLGTGSADSGACANDTGVDGAGHAVLLLDIDLGQMEVLLSVCIVVFDVSSGGSVHHVSHLEALNSLIFGNTSSTVKASDDIRVALVMLSSSVVSSLRWHILINNNTLFSARLITIFILSLQ